MEITELIKKLRATESRSKRELLDEAADALESMHHDLWLRCGCRVCTHQTGMMACEFGGCNGGGDGKHPEDLWEYKMRSDIR